MGRVALSKENLESLGGMTAASSGSSSTVTSNESG